MPKLLDGKLALVLGIANKWSLAYAIAQAFSREGARLKLGDLVSELSHQVGRADHPTRP